MLRRVLAIVFAAVVIAPALAQNKSGGGILVIPPTYAQRGVIVQVFPGDQGAGDDRPGRERASEAPRFPAAGLATAGRFRDLHVVSPFPAGR